MLFKRPGPASRRLASRRRSSDPLLQVAGQILPRVVNLRSNVVVLLVIVQILAVVFVPIGGQLRLDDGIDGLAAVENKGRRSAGGGQVKSERFRAGGRQEFGGEVVGWLWSGGGAHYV
jgi:hypothetical protein